MSRSIKKSVESLLRMPETIEEAKKLYSQESNNSTPDNYSNIIEATPLIVKTVKDLHKLEELKKQLLANEDRLKLEVMNYMQMHALLASNGVIIASWKNSTRKSFDTIAFKKEFPDLYTSYLQDINIRCFRLC